MTKAEDASSSLQRKGSALSSPMRQLTEEEVPAQDQSGASDSGPVPQEKVREMLPQDVVAMHLIDEGKKRMTEGDYEGAVEGFEQAVSTSPSQPHGYYFLATVSFLRKQYRQALAFLEKAELLFGHSPEWQGEVYSLRGAIYEEVGDEARARLAYEHALQFTPQNLSALSGLARLYVEREEGSEPPNQ